MKPKDLMDLMDFISRSNFVEFELEHEGFKLRLVKSVPRRHSRALGQVAAEARDVTLPPPAAVAPPAPAVPAPAPAAPAPAPAAPAVEAGLVDVRSPMVGTFYRRLSPEAPALVELGQRVRKGTVLCIVEAMKLMNEIESEVGGEVVEVLAENGQPVEYGEVLFRLRPEASA
ncbi:MAG: acetyl-CoA carboxylase biotin carboxyl carrier protein [Acidobacteriota bacterium]